MASHSRQVDAFCGTDPRIIFMTNSQKASKYIFVKDWSSKDARSLAFRFAIFTALTLGGGAMSIGRLERCLSEDWPFLVEGQSGWREQIRIMLWFGSEFTEVKPGLWKLSAREAIVESMRALEKERSEQDPPASVAS